MCICIYLRFAPPDAPRYGEVPLTPNTVELIPEGSSQLSYLRTSVQSCGFTS